MKKLTAIFACIFIFSMLPGHSNAADTGGCIFKFNVTDKRGRPYKGCQVKQFGHLEVACTTDDNGSCEYPVTKMLFTGGFDVTCGKQFKSISGATNFVCANNPQNVIHTFNVSFAENTTATTGKSAPQSNNSAQATSAGANGCTFTFKITDESGQPYQGCSVKNVWDGKDACVTGSDGMCTYSTNDDVYYTNFKAKCGKKSKSTRNKKLDCKNNSLNPTFELSVPREQPKDKQAANKKDATSTPKSQETTPTPAGEQTPSKKALDEYKKDMNAIHTAYNKKLRELKKDK